MIVFTAFAAALCTSCSTRLPVETKDFIMGTTVSQKVYGKNARAAADDAVSRMRELEAMLSFFNPDSDISKLNTAAGNHSVTLRPETVFLLHTSVEYANASNGAFDILVGPLVKRWKVTAGGSVPPDSEIKELLKLIDYRDLTVNKAKSTAFLAKKGEMADLGGIAKGFAADEVIRIYKSHGIDSAIIDIGGNISVLGKNGDGSLWKVGIQNPEKDRGISVGYLELENKALSTSGAYERFFKSGGKQYHHILDPKTGYPSNSDLISTTIIADSSTDTDALSTATFVLGSEEGLKLIANMKNVSAVFITKDKRIHATKDLAAVLTVTDGSAIDWK
jgi:thiamine biosynthesis lipoprotein